MTIRRCENSWVVMRFIPPMLLLRKDSLPEGADWLYELKLDGYRTLATKTTGKAYLRSRNDKDFTAAATPSVAAHLMRSSLVITRVNASCAARTRNGFTPALRATSVKKFHGLESAECPFANLPESKRGRWSEGLTAEKMKECRWLKPVLVGEFEFLE